MSKEIFEKQLKSKISQKASQRETDEAYLVKSCKFFDIYGKGTLTYPQFHQALEKIGLFYTLNVSHSNPRILWRCCSLTTPTEMAPLTTKSSRSTSTAQE